MSTQPARLLTIAEYLVLERSTPERHQYYRGEVFAMGGASRSHNRIASNIAAALNHEFQKRNCEEFIADMRVRVSQTGLYTYPDVVALCQQPEFDDEHQDTLVNPEVIFEVLPESTEAYDRGQKFGLYREIESLTDYVLVAQDRVSVEHYRRSSDGTWILHPLEAAEQTLAIESIGVAIPLAEIYRKVKFAQPGDPE